MQKAFQTLPTWLLLLMGFLVVALLGVVDYVTGDYSILIFYAIPVAFAAWFVGRWGSVVISIAAGIARFVSDYISYAGTSFSYWNSMQDMIFLLMVGLLIATVKKLIGDEEKSLGE